MFHHFRCRKLPKGMKDWPAFLDLSKKIDDFNETCPILELMANKSMKERHWKRISKATNYNFEIDSPTFTLRNVMEAPLLKNKDEVEVIFHIFIMYVLVEMIVEIYRTFALVPKKKEI